MKIVGKAWVAKNYVMSYDMQPILTLQEKEKVPKIRALYIFMYD